MTALRLCQFYEEFKVENSQTKRKLQQRRVARHVKTVCRLDVLKNVVFPDEIRKKKLTVLPQRICFSRIYSPALKYRHVWSMRQNGGFKRDFQFKKVQTIKDLLCNMSG